MLCPPVDVGVGANRGGDIEGDPETSTGGHMAGVTWEATIRLPENGDQVRVRVVAPTHFAARQLIELQYDDAQILFGPIRVDLMRAV
jgi:hypothetical protein